LTSLLLFLNHCFNSMEVEVLRMQVQRLVTLPMWTSLYDVSESSEPLSSQTNRSIII
jgi:intron-binding protein aquarius